MPCDLLVEPGMYHATDVLLGGKTALMTAYRQAMLDALRAPLAD